MVGLRFRSGTGQRESQKANPPATKKQQKKKEKEKCRTHTQEETRSEEEVVHIEQKTHSFQIPQTTNGEVFNIEIQSFGKEIPTCQVSHFL